jgi:putative membrane protein
MRGRNFSVEDLTMRWFHLGVIVLLATATIVFAAQNFQMVTVSFLRLSTQTPFAFLIAVIYLLGAATGGSLLLLLRRSIEGAKRHVSAAS